MSTTRGTGGRMLNQGVLAGVCFLGGDAVFILLANAITRAMQRTANSIGLPASLYRPVFVRFVGGIPIVVGVVALLIFWQPDVRPHAGVAAVICHSS